MIYCTLMLDFKKINFLIMADDKFKTMFFHYVEGCVLD